MKYKLLSIEADAKTRKGSKKGVLTGILYLAPAKEADGIHNVCVNATKECEKACLYGAGMAGVFPSIKAARIAKTLRFFSDPEGFTADLVSDITKLIKEADARGMTCAVRLNGTSDLPKLARRIAVMFPDVQFYDYTKHPAPWKRILPNYHLTFSFSGENLSQSFEALEHGINVAVVFTGGLPETWHGFQVINGDESDVRFMDAVGVIVGLKAKGVARSMTAGSFIQIGGAI